VSKPKFTEKSFRGDRTRSHRSPARPLNQGVGKRNNGASKINQRSRDLGTVKYNRGFMPYHLTITDGYIVLTLNHAAIRLDGDRRACKFTLARVDRDAKHGYTSMVSKDQFLTVAMACSFDPSPAQSMICLMKAIKELVIKAPSEHTRQTASPQAIAPTAHRNVRPNRLGIVRIN